ncbi:MAG: TIGR00341 family protein [Chitinophagaceae bacterium]
MNAFFDKFKLNAEKEELKTVIAAIENGVAFRGTNLWILIFAILVASLGLNVNSTAVIIGAMLISPLMGPIMGIGLGLGINDISLLRRSISNYFVATGVALTASTFFFLVSPLNDAHSEILARTSPTIYDVLIALFGGFAGVIATSSKQKGNVVPGVAIATALMPPLCTAGYGLATFQFTFFFGAFYLFIINTVFISLATLLIVRILHFPYKYQQTKRAEKIARRIVWLVVLMTLLPSLYFGYDLVRQSRFIKRANFFVANEAHFPNDFLLSKKIDPQNKIITLVFGGTEIQSEEIAQLKSEMKKYNLESALLEIKQGFSYLTDVADVNQKEQFNELKSALEDKENTNKLLSYKLDSINNKYHLNQQVYSELRAQYPEIKSAVIQQSNIITDSSVFKPIYLVLLSVTRNLSATDKTKILNWLKVRLNEDNFNLIIQK